MPVVGPVGEDKELLMGECGMEMVAAGHCKGEEDDHTQALAAQEVYSKEFGKKDGKYSEALFAAVNWISEFDGAVQLAGMDLCSCDPGS